jgi:uncharacterized protein (DUF58 family)
VTTLRTPFSPQFLNKLETLRLRARRRFLGKHRGLHLSPRRGMSLEFAEYRRYAPGDDPRTVDWGAYARTDRLYVRVFQEEENLYGYMLVDASASMAHPPADGKAAAANALALALCYVILSSEDSVRLHRLKTGRDDSTPFYFGRRRMTEVQEFLEREPPGEPLDLKRSLARHLGGLRRPGKAILISDLLFPPREFQAGLNLLRSAKLDILVIQTLGRGELAPPATGIERLVDAESGRQSDVRLDARGQSLYARNLARHRREIVGLCHRSDVQYALYDTSTDLEDFVLTELPALGLLRE